MKVKTSITLDEAILTKIDDLRGIVSRSAWINHELEACVANSGDEHGVDGEDGVE